jgi:hypothetical protein
MLQHAERLHNRGLLANAYLQKAIVPHLKGDWQTACSWYERGLEIAPTWFLLLGYRAHLAYEVGDFVSSQDYLDKFF